jgi:hypothetical protein
MPFLRVLWFPVSALAYTMLLSSFGPQFIDGEIYDRLVMHVVLQSITRYVGLIYSLEN